MTILLGVRIVHKSVFRVNLAILVIDVLAGNM